MVEIAQNAIKYAKEKGFDTVVDTAGRLAVDTEMMKFSRVHKAINHMKPLFVVDAMTGQDAVNTLQKSFNDILNFDELYINEIRWHTW
jgi:signal recognition particle subunit SRP54